MKLKWNSSSAPNCCLKQVWSLQSTVCTLQSTARNQVNIDWVWNIDAVSVGKFLLVWEGSKEKILSCLVFNEKGSPSHKCVNCSTVQSTHSGADYFEIWVVKRFMMFEGLWRITISKDISLLTISIYIITLNIERYNWTRLERYLMDYNLTSLLLKHCCSWLSYPNPALVIVNFV